MHAKHVNSDKQHAPSAVHCIALHCTALHCIAPDLEIVGMAVSLENARINTLCMPAELSGFAAHCRLHCTGKTDLIHCIALARSLFCLCNEVCSEQQSQRAQQACKGYCFWHFPMTLPSQRFLGLEGTLVTCVCASCKSEWMFCMDKNVL